MNARMRILLVTTLMVFAIGVWFAPTQAQRPVQKSAPARAGKPSKGPAAKPTARLPKARQSKSVEAVEFHAVGFAESPPARSLPSAATLVAVPGGPEVEGHEINELNTENGRKALADKPSFDAGLQGNTKARTPGAPSPA